MLWTADRRAGQRKQGLCDALSRHGIAAGAQVDVPLPASLALGRSGLAQLLAERAFDVIVCSSDTLAQGAIMEAESRGLRVPQELAVIGFGDLDFAASNRPAITTVSVDRRAIGQRAASLLADRIEQIPREDDIIDVGFHWWNENPHKLPASQNNKESAMPHVDIKCFPRDLNDEQKSALAADITDVIIRHLQSKDSSVSVALNEIEPEAWQGVWDVEIAPQMAG